MDMRVGQTNSNLNEFDSSCARKHNFEQPVSGSIEWLMLLLFMAYYIFITSH